MCVYRLFGGRDIFRIIETRANGVEINVVFLLSYNASKESHGGFIVVVIVVSGFFVVVVGGIVSVVVVGVVGVVCIVSIVINVMACIVSDIGIWAAVEVIVKALEWPQRCEQEPPSLYLSMM